MRPASWQQHFARETPGLVAVIPRRIDFDHARQGHWYRIPVKNAPPGLASMAWVAFYFPAVFGREKWSVRYWASLQGVSTVRRAELLPAEPEHPRADDLYYRLALSEVQRRPEPIFSRRRRRIVFIPSVWHKFASALEINDLHHGSPLEDRLWAAFKQEGIEAERQWFEGEGETTYCLDFALFCPQRNIDVECDGDSWHSNPQQARLDNDRNNFLEQRGWHVLRFTGAQLNYRLDGCVRDIRNTISRCGGLVLGNGTVRVFGDANPASPTFSREGKPPPVQSAARAAPGRDQLPASGVDLKNCLGLRRSIDRRGALATLQALHGIEALTKALGEALTSLPPDRRARAVWCLGELPPSSAAVALLAASLPVEKCRNVRRLTYSAFTKLGSRDSEEVILCRLGEEENQVLEYAVRALEVCGSRKAIMPLLQLRARTQPSHIVRAVHAALRSCGRR
jgi:very-short-patch-repair endonuclease